MPCYFPLQATYVTREDGKKSIAFSNANAKLFASGVTIANDYSLSLPCGRCMGCRLEHSRQWALRCVHEAKMFSDSCFVTLTYSPEHMPQGGTLVRKDPQDFLKRLRRRFEGLQAVMINGELRKPIRYYGCGEYGDQLSRPHYHFCLFNFDFPDRKKFSKVNGFTYYTSEILSDVWGLGHCLVTDFSFETAAYVARYCTKKVTGEKSIEHYAGRIPEFSMMSNRPGIGAIWLEKYGQSDVFPHDECIARGNPCKPPRYYDKLRERVDPEGFARIKEVRKLVGESKADDNTFDRLATKLNCMRARFSKLIRRFDNVSH